MKSMEEFGLNSYFSNDIDSFNKEDNITHWMLSDENDMRETFGEDLVSAVKEALNYE